MTYPELPGWKDNDTSRKAALKVAPKSRELREKILTVLEHKPSSADELAIAFGLPVTTIRPRVTELFKQNKIKDSGFRRITEGGCSAKVWQIANITPFVPPIFDSAGQALLFA